MGAKLGFVAARARTVVAAASGASTGRAYVSFLSDAGAGRTAYGERTYARLATLMQAHDSTNVFGLNRNVEPAAGSGTREQAPHFEEFRIVAADGDGRVLELRVVMTRFSMPYECYASESDARRRLLEEAGVDRSHLPVVIR